MLGTIWTHTPRPARALTLQSAVDENAIFRDKQDAFHQKPVLAKKQSVASINPFVNSSIEFIVGYGTNSYNYETHA
jgi:hypothetical protein